MKQQESRIFGVVLYLTDVLTLLAAYVIAVVLRYNIMDSNPGIDALSAPYILTAVIYALLMATALQLLNKENSKYRFRTDNNLYFRIFLMQLIGCLALLSFFYIANAIYFSRMALVIFWVVSSALLILKNDFLRYRIGKKLRNGEKSINVLIVGDGKAAIEYARSLICYPNYGFRLVGFLLEKADEARAKAFLAELDSCTISTCGSLSGDCGFNMFDKIPSDGIMCKGNFDDLENVIRDNDVDDVVFCSDSIESNKLAKMLKMAGEHKKEIFFVAENNKFLPLSSEIFEIGGVKLLRLKKNKTERNIFHLGLAVSVIVLLLFLLMNNLNRNIPGFDRFSSYKSLMFAITAVFGYGCFISVWNIKTLKGNIKCALTTCIMEAALIGVYEFIYYAGNISLKLLRRDSSLTIAFILVSFIIVQISIFFENDDSMLWL